jgi:hypothetical protein
MFLNVGLMLAKALLYLHGDLLWSIDMTIRVLLFVLCAVFAVNSFADKVLCPNVPLVKNSHLGSWIAPQGWTIVQKIKLNTLVSIDGPEKTLALICENQKDGKKVCSYLFTPKTCTICILKLQQN